MSVAATTAATEMIHGRERRRPTRPVSRNPASGSPSTSSTSNVSVELAAPGGMNSSPPSSAPRIGGIARYSFIDAYSSTSGVLRLR